MVPTRLLVAALAAAAVLPTAIYYIYYAGPYQTWIYVEDGAAQVWLNYTGLVREYAPGPTCDIYVAGRCYSFVREFYATRGLWLEPGRLYYVDGRLYVREVKNVTGQARDVDVYVFYNRTTNTWWRYKCKLYLVYRDGVLYKPPPACPAAGVYAVEPWVGTISLDQYVGAVVTDFLYASTYDDRGGVYVLVFQVVGRLEGGRVVFNIPNDYVSKLREAYIFCGPCVKT